MTKMNQIARATPPAKVAKALQHSAEDAAVEPAPEDSVKRESSPADTEKPEVTPADTENPEATPAYTEKPEASPADTEKPEASLAEEDKTETKIATLTKNKVDSLSIEDVQARSLELLDLLKQKETYDDQNTLKILKWLGRIYWDKTKHRSHFGDLLSEHGIAEQAAKMLTYFDALGLFKSDDVWFPAYYTFNFCWNFSDASKKLTVSMGNAGFVQRMATNIKHEPYWKNQKSKNVIYILKSSLSILQNLAKWEENGVHFAESKVKEHLMRYMKSENEFFKATATLVLTQIMSEDENKMLEDTGAISFFAGGLSKALSLPENKRRYRGFSPLELISGLSRMAVNDNNKVKIVEAGSLPSLVKMMEYTDEEEQYEAARAIWNLCFEKSIRKQIREEPRMMETLKRLTDSDNAKVRRMANGALWTLNDDAHQVKDGESEKSKQTEEHIFISYAWSNADMVHKVKDKLKADGFPVWIDVEQMAGSTLEAMASAVENAKLVIICASESYKTSPNCRTEAEYTFQRKKPILPMMMQRYYKPDGWLGMLLGAKFYINMDGKYELEEAYQMLLRELKGILRESVDVKEKVETCAVDGPVVAATHIPNMASVPPAQTAAIPSAASWDTAKVDLWFTEQGLDKMKDGFAGYDGKLLIRLNNIRREAPEFFYRHLSEQLGLNMLNIVRLVESMETGLRG